MSRTAVLALGGNALARAGEPPTITNQFRHARESIAPIVELDCILTDTSAPADTVARYRAAGTDVRLA